MQESYLIFVFFESLVMWTLNLRGQEKCHYRFKPFFKNYYYYYYYYFLGGRFDTEIIKF